MQKKLSDLKVNEKGHVVKLSGEGRVRRRLLDMGVTPGVEISVEKFAPLGDPMEVLLRGYHLSLRKVEANEVWMEV